MIKIIVILIKCEGFFCFVNIVVETVGRRCSDIDAVAVVILWTPEDGADVHIYAILPVDQRLQFTSLAAD